MTVPRFLTGGRHQASPAFIQGHAPEKHSILQLMKTTDMHYDCHECYLWSTVTMVWGSLYQIL